MFTDAAGELFNRTIVTIWDGRGDIHMCFFSLKLFPSPLD